MSKTLRQKVFDLDYICGDEFRPAVPFAKSMSLSVNHIFHIVGMVAVSQMGRIYTIANIARMQRKAFGPLSVGKKKRVAMGGNRAAVNHQLSIPARCYNSRPNPTSLGFGNTGPKPFFGGWRSVKRITVGTPILIVSRAKSFCQMYLVAIRNCAEFVKLQMTNIRIAMTKPSLVMQTAPSASGVFSIARSNITSLVHRAIIAY